MTARVSAVAAASTIDTTADQNRGSSYQPRGRLPATGNADAPTRTRPISGSKCPHQYPHGRDGIDGSEPTPAAHSSH